MRIRTSTSVTFCVFAIGLGVVACSSGGSSSTQAGTGSSTAAAAQRSQAASGGLCQPANLSFTLGAKIAGTGTTQPTQVVDLTNKGTSACTMKGFPGVNLVGVANGKQDYTWPLTRSSASNASASNQGISEVTLPPGGTAHFDLRYLPAIAGDGNRHISVGKIVITPPNDYAQGQLTWQQEVVLQDAATRPGTYVMPVVSGS